MTDTTLTFDTWPERQVEVWADQMKDLYIVPQLSWQGVLFIHRRKLAFYA